MTHHRISLGAIGQGLLFATLILSAGCSRLSRSNREAVKEQNPSDDLKVTIAPDKEAYRPGESMLITVTVTNTSQRAIKIRPLDHRSITFWFGPRGQDRRLEREPVVSRKEDKLEGAPSGGDDGPLAPGGTRARRFLHTRFTTEAGVFIAQAHGDLFDDQAKQAGRVYSEPVAYRVEGEPLCARDAEGLLMKEDAVRIAVSQRAGAVPSATEAILILDDMGFYKWWINLDYGVEHESWLVDPYQARVWAKAQPFPKTQKPEPKIRLRGSGK